MSAAFSWPQLAAALDSATAVAGFQPEILCHTAAGPLTAWSRSASAAAPWIYLSAGIHGDEPAGSLAILRLLQQGFFDQLPAAAYPWRLCPALNPTGLAQSTRHGHCGQDFNRDYSCRHSAEIRAHARWLEAGPLPQLFLSLHEDWEASGCYFYEIRLPASLTTDAAQARARLLLNALETHLPIEPATTIDGHLLTVPGWIDHPPEPDEPEGWPEAIYLAKLGCPQSFTFETPSCAALESRVAAHCAAVAAAVDLFGRESTEFFARREE